MQTRDLDERNDHRFWHNYLVSSLQLLHRSAGQVRQGRQPYRKELGMTFKGVTHTLSDSHPASLAHYPVHADADMRVC